MSLIPQNPFDEAGRSDDITKSNVGFSWPTITSTLIKFSNPSPPQMSTVPASPNPNAFYQTTIPSNLTVIDSPDQSSIFQTSNVNLTLLWAGNVNFLDAVAPDPNLSNPPNIVISLQEDLSSGPFLFPLTTQSLLIVSNPPCKSFS